MWNMSIHNLYRMSTFSFSINYIEQVSIFPPHGGMDSFNGGVRKKKVSMTKAGHWLRKGREEGGPSFTRIEWGSLGEGEQWNLYKGGAEWASSERRKCVRKKKGKSERIREREKEEALFNRALWKALWMASVCFSHTGHRRNVLSAWKGGL